MKYPLHLTKLIESFKKLPGVGKKSAERFAFELLSWEPSEWAEMAEIIKTIPHNIHFCDTCGCIKDLDACKFCSDERAASGKLCIIASPKDAFILDETGEYRGLYHVIGALISPIEGIGCDAINNDAIKKRVIDHDVKEVVIALDSTLEGDATSLYIKEFLDNHNLKISRLAFGIPMGSSLDYVDAGTLARALHARSCF